MTTPALFTSGVTRCRAYFPHVLNLKQIGRGAWSKPALTRRDARPNRELKRRLSNKSHPEEKSRRETAVWQIWKSPSRIRIQYKIRQEYYRIGANRHLPKADFVDNDE